jgi:hypothetical protein
MHISTIEADVRLLELILKHFRGSIENKLANAIHLYMRELRRSIHP